MEKRGGAKGYMLENSKNLPCPCCSDAKQATVWLGQQQCRICTPSCHDECAETPLLPPFRDAAIKLAQPTLDWRQDLHHILPQRHQHQPTSLRIYQIELIAILRRCYRVAQFPNVNILPKFENFCGTPDRHVGFIRAHSSTSNSAQNTVADYSAVLFVSQ